MISRMSSLFVRTLREDPADAEVPSHRLLVRAGYIRRAAPGIYTWLPLGQRGLPGTRRASDAEDHATGRRHRVGAVEQLVVERDRGLGHSSEGRSLALPGDLAIVEAVRADPA